MTLLFIRVTCSWVIIKTTEKLKLILLLNKAKRKLLKPPHAGISADNSRYAAC